MSNYRQQIAAAVQAARITSPTSFSWLGMRANRLASARQHKLTPEAARSYLLNSLQNTLYNAFYCSGEPVLPHRRSTVPASGRTPFVAALSSANAGSGYWDHGWEICAVDGPRIVIRRGELTIWVQPNNDLVDHTTIPAPGAHLRLRRSKELLHVSPGFYMALGDKALALDEEPLVRIYWHLTAQLAVPLISAITQRLNQLRFPYRLKVLNQPACYTRCDSAVLYLRRCDYLLARSLLEHIYAELRPNMGFATPAFTKLLAPGLALAEDPGLTESFGMHRCRLLAEGIIRAHDQRRRTLAERMETVILGFNEAKISIDTPYLSHGSSDMYPFDVPPSFPGVSRMGASPPPPASCNPATFSQTAELLGQLLLKRVIWHEGYCNWLGDATQHDQPKRNSGTSVYQVLEPDLYKGTSGIGLFLSQLAAATGDQVLRRTALGALRQALRMVDAVPPIYRLGLYTGWVGIALAAVRAGLALGEQSLLDDAGALVRRAARELPEIYAFDLLSGSAGAVVGLAAIHDVLRESWLLEFATQLGDGLLQSAAISPAGCSWPSVEHRMHDHLTGFAHGAAGIGYALLELYRKTGDDRYRSGADGAFRYERSWFDETAQNWADLRSAARSARPRIFAHGWCHGAPGIAISRLRAYELLGDSTSKLEAITALQTTQRIAERMAHAAASDFSLCHGLAGNAAIMCYGRQVLGPSWSMNDQIITDIAEAANERHVSGAGRPWAAESYAGETPGLMIGLAGIGAFYLGLANSSLPLFLTLHTQDPSSSQAPRRPPDEANAPERTACRAATTA